MCCRRSPWSHGPSGQRSRIRCTNGTKKFREMSENTGCNGTNRPCISIGMSASLCWWYGVWATFEKQCLYSNCVGKRSIILIGSGISFFTYVVPLIIFNPHYCLLETALQERLEKNFKNC